MVCQNKVTIERQIPSLALIRMEVVARRTVMSRWIKRTLGTFILSMRGYDMVKVYNKMSDYKPKGYGLLISSWDTVLKH
jgi:hypothetical protein